MENQINNTNKSIKILTAMVIVLIALVIVLGGSFAYMYFNNESSNVNKNPEVENNETPNDNQENTENKEDEKEEEPEKTISFADRIFENNEVMTKKPNLEEAFGDSGDKNGLYASTDTNSGEPTYYFRGDEVKNYVKFAGKNWRIIRINEDETIRLILTESIGSMMFSSDYDNVKNSYYSNSDIVKPKLESWYKNNVANNSNYSSKVATGNYYCEQAKVISSSSSQFKNVPVPDNYQPNFKCSTDSNGYGKVNSSIGLITYDEVVYAGSQIYESESDRDYESHYLNGYDTWTMSPGCKSNPWSLQNVGWLQYWMEGNFQEKVHPVINLKADVEVTGTGTINDPYIVQ